MESDERVSIINYEEIQENIKNTDIIINTTPTNILQNKPENSQYKNILACDIVYKPKDTNFLLCFKKENRIYGISMLIYQAAPCFEEWFGVRPIIDKGLFELLDKHIN